MNILVLFFYVCMWDDRCDGNIVLRKFQLLSTRISDGNYICFHFLFLFLILFLFLFSLFIWQAGLFDEVLVNDDFQLTVNTMFRLMRDWWVCKVMDGFCFILFISIMFGPHHCDCLVILFAELYYLLRYADTLLHAFYGLVISHFSCTSYSL